MLLCVYRQFPYSFLKRTQYLLQTRCFCEIKEKSFEKLTHKGMVVSTLKEINPEEHRVSLTPLAACTLLKRGINVKIESGAGVLASISDEEFARTGAKIVNKKEAVAADILLKVRCLEMDEVSLFRPNSTLISFIFPENNKTVVDLLVGLKMTVFVMDKIPQISRAQVFDTLSSMANIVGYKAVIETANSYGKFFAGQITAAGKVPPAKVLVVGGDVAGLSAIATAKNLGAIVKDFDTRTDVKEQVQSLVAEFLEIKLKESGEGSDGYAKEMSPEFIAAEMELFRQQCRDVDVIISTATIPGKKAPVLFTKEMISLMKPGSVVVDLVAEPGGIFETTRPGEVYTNDNGVLHIGYKQMPNRLAGQSSVLYANNITKFLLAIGDQKENFFIDLKDEVVRGSIILHNGTLLWSPPVVAQPSPTTQPKSNVEVEVIIPKEESHFIKNLKKVSLYAGAIGSTNLLGYVSPNMAFTQTMTTFSVKMQQPTNENNLASLIHLCLQKNECTTYKKILNFVKNIHKNVQDSEIKEIFQKMIIEETIIKQNPNLKNIFFGTYKLNYNKNISGTEWIHVLNQIEEIKKSIYYLKKESNSNDEDIKAIRSFLCNQEKEVDLRFKLQHQTNYNVYKYLQIIFTHEGELSTFLRAIFDKIIYIQQP